MSAGLITGLIFGIASLVIGVIIAFVIVSTLNDANLLQEGRTTVTISNEAGGYINDTGYTLASTTLLRYLPESGAIVEIYNATDTVLIAPGNYTLSTDGVLTNTTDVVWTDVNITYTYTQKTNEEVSTTALTTNFTAGVDNVSSKIPTVLLIGAIVLILGVLVLLVTTWQRMRIGGGGI